MYIYTYMCTYIHMYYLFVFVCPTKNVRVDPTLDWWIKGAYLNFVVLFALSQTECHLYYI